MERVRIALQKSGRLAEDSLSLLRNCGLHIDRSKDQLFCRVQELPIDILMIRDDDIPGFVSSGICDLGIVGENVFAEEQGKGADLSARIVERLGFSFCRLAIAAPETSAAQEFKDLDGKTIATSYPVLLQKALEEQNIKAKILHMTGSVEVAPRLKIADAICDIIASGATLAANNLREMEVLLRSEALLIRSARTLCEERRKPSKGFGRMRGALQAEDSKTSLLHAKKRAAGYCAFADGRGIAPVLPLRKRRQNRIMPLSGSR
jgi:ATP phosphoribosyltransferase